MKNVNNNLQKIVDCKNNLKNILITKHSEPTGGLTTYADAIRGIKIFDLVDTGWLNGEKFFPIQIDRLNSLDSDLNYTRQKYLEWDPANTSANRLYQGDFNIIYAPKIDTKNVTDMSLMFYGCNNLYAIPQLDTQNVTDMQSMFSKCYTLNYIPLLNTIASRNMKEMFWNCNKLKTIPQLDTQNVTDMQGIFKECNALNYIPQLNTSNVTNMKEMFWNCNKLKTIPQLDTRNVTDMSFMFYECSSLHYIPKLNTSNVTNMQEMFGSYDGNCGIIEVPEMDISKVTNMKLMFYDCKDLKKVRFKGGHKGIDCTNMFLKAGASGYVHLLLLKNDGGDYSDIIAALPSSWSYIYYD